LTFKIKSRNTINPSEAMAGGNRHNRKNRKQLANAENKADAADS
jgi:hypothetical protein